MIGSSFATLPLANADAGPSSDSTMLLILGSLALLVVTAILAAVPMIATRRRPGRAAPVVFSCTVLWAIAAAALGLATLFGYAHWSQENNVLVLSGYYDPASAPVFAWHAPAWAALAVLYPVLLAAAFLRPRRL